MRIFPRNKIREDNRIADTCALCIVYRTKPHTYENSRLSRVV